MFMARFCLSTGERSDSVVSLSRRDRKPVTTMLMDGMDTGHVAESCYTNSAIDNAQDLASRLAGLGADLLVETLLLERQEIQPPPR